MKDGPLIWSAAEVAAKASAVPKAHAAATTDSTADLDIMLDSV